MSKFVKNEQWRVSILISKMDNKEISKPKFQRKKKWDILPKKENNPNEKSYIMFLFEVKNSVHAITFGQNMYQNKITFTNIDGNNRLNAIKHFIDKPFEIFPEYLDELISFINTLSNLEENDKNFLINIFNTISYSNIIEIKFHKYFESINKHDFYVKKIKNKRDEFEAIIDIIQNKLKINEKDRFDQFVSINVNLFEGYNTDELCKIFEDINKFNSKLTENELLACRLYNIDNFKIKNNIIEQSIINEIKNYYHEKCNNEALICYKYETNNKINAYDFIVGFQNYCNEKYKIIKKIDNDGMSLFFKLYKNIYNLDNTFTNKNVNEFIDNIIYSCDIIKKIYDTIFTEQINNKLFNTTCENKFSTLTKNNIYIIISAIWGYNKIGTKDKIIINIIEKIILYHFILNDIKCKEIKERYQINDAIHFEGGGYFIDNNAKKIINNPEIINDKINKDNFKDLINDLFKEGNRPIPRLLENGRPKCDKRRPRKFYEKCLLFYYYKAKVPTNLLNNKFSLEHIFPFSSSWEGEIDIDRIGNIVPIIDEINNKRNNKHISKYIELDIDHNFINFIDVLPKDNVYNIVISHSEIKPTIISNDKYIEYCKSTEQLYLYNFLKCLFP